MVKEVKKMSKKIYLSPSSQWANKYSYGLHTEAEICGIIAECCREELIRNGYDVRVGSNKTTYQQRVSESNNWGADVHIPIHTNAGGGDGTVVFCYPESVNNKYYIFFSI
jgi:N-acetylmuramoyl-L-alanine amidase